MPNLRLPENSSQDFKCNNCGTMFAVKGAEGNCPECGFHCTQDTCRVIDASDEEY